MLEIVLWKRALPTWLLWKVEKLLLEYWSVWKFHTYFFVGKHVFFYERKSFWGLRFVYERKSAVVIDLVNLILSGHRNCCKNTAHTYIFRLLSTEKCYTKKSVKKHFLSFKISKTNLYWCQCFFLCFHYEHKYGIIILFHLFCVIFFALSVTNYRLFFCHALR